MSRALRFVFRRVFLKSINIGSYTQRNYASSVHNRSFNSRLISKPSYVNDQRPSMTQYEGEKNSSTGSQLSKLLVKLENSMTKRGIINLENLNEILETLDERKSLSSSLAIKLIHCCGEMLVLELPLTRIELVQKMWNSFKDYSVEYSIDHYNALLKVYNENQFPFNPFEVMKELSDRGLVPNAETYQHFITKYGYDGDLTNINRLLGIMREKQIPIMIDVYRSLIICHFKNNCLKDAKNVIDIVEKVEPSALPSVRSELVIQYVKRKEIENALKILANELPRVRFSLNEYFNILYELAINDFEEEFRRLLDAYKHPSNYNTKVPMYITKLIANDRAEYAFFILRSMHQLTRTSGVKIALAPFFVSILVRNDVPCNRIVKLCLDLMKSNSNELALQTAMHESLRIKNEKLALSLFHAAKSNNLPVRLHYFWPLLLNRAKNNDINGVFYLMEIMYNHYNLVANSETLRFYIIPFIYSKNMDVVAFMYKFKPYGVTLSTLVCAIVHHLLIIHEFQKAAEVAECYGARYPMDRYEKITVDLYVETKDCQSFVKLMKAYCMGSIWQLLNKNSPKKCQEEIILYDHRHFFNSMTYTAVQKLMQEENGVSHIAKLFQCMIKNKITISSEIIDKMEKQLFTQEKLDGNLSSLLEQMKLEKITTKLTFKSETEDDPDNCKLMERLYEDMEVGNETSDLNKRYLFNLYAKHHNLEKLLNLKQKLEAENYKLSSGMYSYVLDTLVEHNQWEEALKLYRDRIQNDEHFHLDYLKLNRFASLLVRNDRIEDAYKILSEHRSSQMENQRRGALATAAYGQLLQSLAEKGDTDRLEAFFELFRAWGFKITEIILEPLIEIHLRRNDVSTALKEYVKCVLQYNFTPCMEKLMRALIIDGDKNKMSKFVSASSLLHPEGRTLYDLIINYSELNEIEEAKKVLQSQIFKSSRGGSERLKMVCEKYCTENDTKNLHNLFVVTKGTKLLDRDDLCSKILTTCINTNDVEKAQILWIEMQDENLAPPPEFLNSLAKLFKSNGCTVKFDYTDESDENIPVLEVSSANKSTYISVSKRKGSPD